MHDLTYSSISKMIAILNENGANEVRIRGPQIGLGTVKVSHQFAVLFHQGHIVFGHILGVR